MKILVTGSCGLIGFSVSRYLGSQGHHIIGLDNNQRANFFGKDGETLANRDRLHEEVPYYQHSDTDIRDREGVLSLIKSVKPNAIVHTAAQPSHDRAAAIPFQDFDTNANGTHNLLEAARRYCMDSPFVFMSTNKVYGDRPNQLALTELETRFDFADPEYQEGIGEDLGIDLCQHSLFGVSKCSADLMVQEYGRYFDMPTCCLRGGCLTGPNHSGVELHGFLSYLVKCNVEQKPYTIYGYKGKQVRDNIHADDVAAFIQCYINRPRPAAVYNIGGGKENSCSILEAISAIEELTAVRQEYVYSDKNRKGDHICYYSNLARIRNDYPGWKVTVSLKSTLRQIIEAWLDKNETMKPLAKVI